MQGRLTLFQIGLFKSKVTRNYENPAEQQIVKSYFAYQSAVDFARVVYHNVCKRYPAYRSVGNYFSVYNQYIGYDLYD